MTECVATTEQLPMLALVWLSITAFIGWRMYCMGRFLERRSSERRDTP